MSAEREIMTWDIFGTASRALAQMVADDGYEPDMVLAIARGGLLIGGAIGYALSVKNVYTMNVEFYTGVDERLEVPGDPAAGARLRRRVRCQDPDRRRRGRHRPDASLGARLLRGQGRRGPLASCCTRRPTRSSSATTSGSAPTSGSTSPGATRIRSPSATGRSKTPDIGRLIRSVVRVRQRHSCVRWRPTRRHPGTSPHP